MVRHFGPANVGVRAAPSGRGYIDQREAFLARRVGATLIKRDDLKRCGTMFRCCEGRCKLQCVGRSQRVDAKKSQSALADDLARFNLMPVIGKLFHPVGRERHPFYIERGLFEAGRSRDAFPFRPHHTSLSESRPASACMRRVVRSATSSGTIAEASQISPPLPALFDEDVDSRCAGISARRLAAEQGSRRPGPAGPHKSLTEEPRQPSILPAFEITRHGLEPRNGTVPGPR
jgi:hypothetical protein